MEYGFIGWINLAHVKWVVRMENKNIMRFVFTNLVDMRDGGDIHRESIDLDLKVGELIMSRLRSHNLECFVAG